MGARQSNNQKLIQACIERDNDKILKFLKCNDIDITYIDDKYQPLLHYFYKQILLKQSILLNNKISNYLKKQQLPC